MAKGIENYLDEQGRIKVWPSKQALKLDAYALVAERFEYDREYTEKEVNAIIDEAHTFGDYFLLRRGLVETEWLCRTRDGSKYWKNPEKKPEE